MEFASSYMVISLPQLIICLVHKKFRCLLLLLYILQLFLRIGVGIHESLPAIDLYSIAVQTLNESSLVIIIFLDIKTLPINME